jgi:NlpC/P60 family putative phage cell wall peptidase
MTADDYVQAAREWVGTPFVHQGRMKGRAVDCIGVVYCVAREFGMVGPEVMTAYEREPDGNLLREGLNAHMVRIPAPAQPGDIILFRFARFPQHVAVYTGRNIIHAYERVGKCVEHIYDKRWLKRYVGAYRFPEFVQ